MINYLWKYKQLEDVNSELTELIGDEIIAKILNKRGINTGEEMEKFLNPLEADEINPYIFADMQKAVDRIYKAIEDNEHILVYGDFDADGITSSSLMFKTLSHIGANVSYYIPSRDKEGHGIHKKAVLKLKSKRQAKLLITTDCGVGNIEEIALLKSLGCDCIVTDHHEASGELPDAVAIINPKVVEKLTEPNNHLKDLAGVGVAYKLAHVLLETSGKLDFIEEILPLVAIGTVADVVPLTLENRILVSKGLQLIKEKKPLNIKLLLKKASAKIENMSSESIAFKLAPRINAAGRLESASLASQLFIEKDENRVAEIVDELSELNILRQELCEQTFNEAMEKLTDEDLDKNTAIILSHDDWNVGMIGIAAARLAEKFYRPAFLIKLDKEQNVGRCSARGVEGLNLYDVLESIKDDLEVFGGHAKAAGFKAELGNVAKVTEKIHKEVNERLKAGEVKPSLNIDAKITPDKISFDFIEKLDRLEPFGETNRRPIFSMENLTVTNVKIVKNKHLKLFFELDGKNTVEAIGWNMPDVEVEVLDKVDIAFKPSLNHFNNDVKIQLEILDIKVHRAEKKQAFPHLVDHRKRNNNIEKILTSYLKTMQNKSFIYAETPEIIKNLSETIEFKPLLKTRFDMPNEADDIFLAEIPADIEALKGFYHSTKTLHFLPFNANNPSSDDILNKICGMLKYVHNNKNGEVNIVEFASKVPSSAETLKKAINLFCVSKLIKPLSLRDNDFKFEYKTPVAKDILMGFDEYKIFLKQLNDEHSFKTELHEKEIDDIKKLFG